MTRRTFLQKYLLKFAVALAMLGLIVYTVGHSVGMRAGELLTTPVRRVTDRQITSVKAYLFRNEEPLVAEKVSLFDGLIAGGNKVSKNAAVANAHPTSLTGEKLAAVQRELDEINRAIRILEESRPTGNEGLASLDAVKKETAADYFRICETVKAGDLSAIGSLEDAFLQDMNRYLILSGKSNEVDAMRKRLEEQKAELLGTGDFATVFNTVSSGVFYGREYVDGFESLFTLEAARTLTEKSFHALLEREPTEAPQDRTVGKMVYGYSWYAAMELPQELTERLKVGEIYSVAFPENGGRSIRMTLERRDGSLAVFRSDESPDGFAYYRAQTAEITLEEREGFYIPDTALCRVNGQDGVYIFENSTVYFRKIVTVYRGDGYCIAADDSEIGENDILITSGKNLYDGKVYE